MSDLPAEAVAIRARLAELDELTMPRPDPAARHDAIVGAATTARFRNPELAARLLADVEGEPSDIVAGLADAEPYLVRPTMDDLIRAAARLKLTSPLSGRTPTT